MIIGEEDVPDFFDEEDEAPEDPVLALTAELANAAFPVAAPAKAAPVWTALFSLSGLLTVSLIADEIFLARLDELEELFDELAEFLRSDFTVVVDPDEEEELFVELEELFDELAAALRSSDFCA